MIIQKASPIHHLFILKNEYIFDEGNLHRIYYEITFRYDTIIDRYIY